MSQGEAAGGEKGLQAGTGDAGSHGREAGHRVDGHEACHEIHADGDAATVGGKTAHHGGPPAEGDDRKTESAACCKQRDNVVVMSRQDHGIGHVAGLAPDAHAPVASRGVVGVRRSTGPRDATRRVQEDATVTRDALEFPDLVRGEGALAHLPSRRIRHRPGTRDSDVLREEGERSLAQILRMPTPACHEVEGLGVASGR